MLGNVTTAAITQHAAAVPQQAAAITQAAIQQDEEGEAMMISPESSTAAIQRMERRSRSPDSERAEDDGELDLYKKDKNTYLIVKERFERRHFQVDTPPSFAKLAWGTNEPMIMSAAAIMQDNKNLFFFEENNDGVYKVRLGANDAPYLILIQVMHHAEP